MKKVKKTKPAKAKKMAKVNVRTDAITTWCPGCFNFQILAGVNKFIEEQIKQNNKTREDFAMVTGIGCHGKIFDYLDIPGMNALHGRVLPVCLGMKVAKPHLTVLGFSGDGDAYAEGMEHLVHMARYNSDIKYIVHNNQVFALTLAEPSPVTEIGYKDKTTPRGVRLAPINPVKLMLSAGASFVARVFADAEQVKQVLDEAQKHKGFCFIEIIQPCVVFHADIGYKERLYDLQKTNHDKTNLKSAMEKAEEWDYNGIRANRKIPTGIFYQKPREVFEELVRK